MPADNERASDKDERPTLPVRSSDEEDSGWGDRPDDDDRDEQLLADKPPHHAE